MNTTKDIKITGVRHEETAWKRYIYFKYENTEYSVLLFWDEFNGYELYWKNEDSALINSLKTPEWAVEWNEDGHDFMTLEHYLDELTYKEQEIK